VEGRCKVEGAQVRSGMKPGQTERVIRNRIECLDHVIVIGKIGRILKRVRSGGGAKSCRSDKGERVIDVKTRSDADSIIGNTDQGLSTPFSLARLRIFLQGSLEGDKLSPEALAKSWAPGFEKKKGQTTEKELERGNRRCRLANKETNANLGFATSMQAPLALSVAFLELTSG